MLKPDDKMLRFLEWERGIFLHFGIRTFNEERRDWDYVDMPIDSFAPTALDCGAWAAAIKEAGFQYAVMTAKHHDGFCLWPTEHSDYSVKHCAWRDGKGDVVKEYLAAMRDAGIRTGLYYSPADQIVFSKTFSQKEHNALIRNHLLELCTWYGPIDYLWFDNCGSDKCVYDWDGITTDVIRTHQPETVVNSNGDVQSCWVGNEAGYAPRPCMYIQDLEAYSEHRVSRTLLDRAEDGRFWSPAEADCMLDEGSWFFRPEGRQLRSLDVLMGIYHYSVGRGINLLLNIGPDRRGLLPEPDRSRLLAFGAEIERRFSRPVATLEDFTRVGDRFRLALEAPAELCHIVLRERIDEGQRIQRFRIKAQPYLKSREDILVYEGGAVGHKAIASFPTLYARELTVEVRAAEGPYTLEGIEVYGPPAEAEQRCM